MDLIKKYRKSPEFIAMISALVMGYITHNFALVNVMHNIDDIGNQPYGYGMGLDMGRWLLTVIGDAARKLGIGYNLPFVNGVIFLLLIAVSAGFLVSALRIRSKVSASLIGMLLVVFPSAVITLVYRFTSVYYGLAFLMAVMGAWVLNRHKYGFLLSAVLVAMSLGIYQAYVSITISIFVLILIRQVLSNQVDIKKLICQGLLDCFALILGLLIYFLCLKVCLSVYGMKLSGSQGVASLGSISLKDIPAFAWNAFSSFCHLPLRNYCGLADMKLIKVAYLLLGGISVAMIGYILIFRVKKISLALLAVALCTVFPIAVNFIQIMAPDSWVYTMMVYSFALVGCVPLVLLECIPDADQKKWKRKVCVKAVTVVLAVLILSYAYQSNVNYTANYYINRQVENYVSSIVTQVRMTEGFAPEKKWALIGKIHDPLLNSSWEYEPTYDGIFHTERTLNDISQYYWFWTYIGYRLPVAEEEVVESLRATPEVKSMPCWPAEGAIRVLGDCVVIKFEE